MIASEYALEISFAYEELWLFIEGKKEWKDLRNPEFVRLSALMGHEGRRVWIQDILEGLVTKSQQGEK